MSEEDHYETLVNECRKVNLHAGRAQNTGSPGKVILLTDNFFYFLTGLVQLILAGWFCLSYF